jgi:hypothetical protein
MRKYFVVLAAAMIGCGGSVNVGTNLEPVPISGTVVQAGKPVSGVLLNLQPTGAGNLPVAVEVKNGAFQAQAAPGRYTWFFEPSKDTAQAKAIEAIPEKYQRGAMDRQIDVASGSTLELKLD